MSEDVGLEVRDGVAWVTIRRPERRNALSPEGMAQFRGALLTARDDPGARVVVVTGEGDQSFCAGTDLSAVDPSSWDPVGHWSATPQGIARSSYYRALNFRAIDLWKPVIAAVNGHCFGAGLEIALQCDIRISSENASFGLLEVRWGTFPAAGGIHFLLESVPRSAAMEMILTGDPVDAARALAIGLVSSCHPLGSLVEAAQELALRIAANAPLAVQAAKRLAVEDRQLGLDQALLLDELTWNVLRATSDRAEGQAAFREKRRPKYTGH